MLSYFLRGDDMIDGHIHLENGSYSEEGLNQFVEQALKKNCNEIYVLEHTHCFYEFYPLYESVIHACVEQKDWYDNKEKIHLDQYLKFIREMKTKNFPIKIHFGLEVCYIPEKEEFLASILSEFPYDFLLGSIHHINSLAFDFDFSLATLWKNNRADDIFQRYFDLNEQCILSGLFNGLAHPDQIKMQQILPEYSLLPYYHQIAENLKESGMFTENNTGAHYRYDHPEVGLNPEFLQILLDEGVVVHNASDAHCLEDIGRCFESI